ncbi:MAG: DUF3047 domain-containing protein [Salinibacter sp.]
MTARRLGSLLIGTLLVGGLVGAVFGPPLLRVGHFSAEAPAATLPEGWEQIRFGENDTSTRYDLVRADSAVVLRAESDNGASGLITHPTVDLEKYPILEWRWKVDALPMGADITEKTADDAAARLYVTFDYEGLGLYDRLKLMLLRRVGYAEAPSRALNYLWASQHERGAAQASPYTDQIMMIPIRSGSTKVGRWVQERRNVLKDYRRVFGEDPPPVNGIALMTDTDNTGGQAAALYGDIVFRAQRPEDAVQPAATEAGR